MASRRTRPPGEHNMTKERACMEGRRTEAYRGPFSDADEYQKRYLQCMGGNMDQGRASAWIGTDPMTNPIGVPATYGELR